MEFLVEFEVDVPGGTATSEVRDREKAEASAAAKLADEGHLVRLWTLNARSGKPRFLGLYDAAGRAELDELLGALPLSAWLAVVVTPLDVHPSDPALHLEARSTASGRTSEYLVTMTTTVPEGTTDEAVAEIRAREAARSGELAARGNLLRLWRPPVQPGEWRTLGLFAADDAAQLEAVLASMPLRVWRTDLVTPLAPHPNDPAGLPPERP